MTNKPDLDYEIAKCEIEQKGLEAELIILKHKFVKNNDTMEKLLELKRQRDWFNDLQIRVDDPVN